MKRLTTLLALALTLSLGLSAYAQNYKEEPAADEKEAADDEKAAADESAFKNDEEKAAYCLGMHFANYVQQMLSDVDIDMLVKGMRDALEEKESLAGDEEARNEFLTGFFETRQKAEAEERVESERKFLEENKEKDDVQVTESGLQYQVLKPGSGATPSATDKVKVHYKGTFFDGEEFDSSYSRGEPTVFGVSQVIKGWTEGLQLMREGAKYKFWIPYELAYGEQGNPRGGMPGSASLIFEVELIKVNPPQEEKAPGGGQ